MHRERERRDGNVGDRLEVLDRIVERPRFQNRLGDVGARSAKQKCVAVGTGMRDGGGAERTSAAALIFHDDSAEQRLDPLGPRAPDGVESAAGRERNDQTDRPLGIVRCRARSRGRQSTNCERRRPEHQEITPSHAAQSPIQHLPRYEISGAVAAGPAPLGRRDALAYDFMTMQCRISRLTSIGECLCR